MPPRTRRIRGNAHGWMLRRGRRDARAMHARDAGRDALAGWISGVAACVDRDVAAAGGISPTAAMARRVLPQIDVGKTLCRRSALGRDRSAVGEHWGATGFTGRACRPPLPAYDKPAPP